MSESDSAPVTNPTPNPDAGLLEALQGEQPEQNDADEVEIELGAEKLKVPKRVKEAWDGIQATTQKDRETIRQEREAVSRERTQQAETAKIMAAFDDERAAVKSIDKQLEPYLKLTAADWAAWGAQDQDAALKAQTQINALQYERQKVVMGIQAKYQEIQQKQAQTETERKANAERDLAAKIKDWSPAKKAELVKTAESVGFNAAEIEPFMADYRVAQILEDARQMRALRAKVAAPKSAPVAEEPPPETTRTRVRANTGGHNPLGDNVPIDQWSENFLKQRAARMKRG